MRKIQSNNRWTSKRLKDVPRGTCPMCGGKGRYKETFKHKAPIIHSCLECRGTGEVKPKVKYLGPTSYEDGLWKNKTYSVLSESGYNYVIAGPKGEMLQLPRHLFEEVDY